MAQSLPKQIDLGQYFPTALETIFGYVIIGSIQTLSHTNASITMVSTSDADFNQLIQQYWSLEESPITSCTTKEEIECENHYVNTILRGSEGRYITSLPFYLNAYNFGNSLAMDKRRFFHLDAKLKANLMLKTAYIDFMND